MLASREISRWISSDLHKTWSPATKPGQIPKPGCDLGLSSLIHRCPKGPGTMHSCVRAHSCMSIC